MFHDGHEMTSADVAYTLPAVSRSRVRVGQEGRVSRSCVRRDRSIATPSRFTSSAPSASFPSNLTNMGIVPDGSGAELARRPIGSGPYRLVEFVPDDHVTLAAFDRYYQGRPQNDGLRPQGRARRHDARPRTAQGRRRSRRERPCARHRARPRAATRNLSVTTAPGNGLRVHGDEPARSHSQGRARARGHRLRDRSDRPSRATCAGARREPAAGIVPPMSWAYADDLFRFAHDPGQSARAARRGRLSRSRWRRSGAAAASDAQDVHVRGLPPAGRGAAAAARRGGHRRRHPVRSSSRRFSPTSCAATCSSTR